MQDCVSLMRKRFEPQHAYVAAVLLLLADTLTLTGDEEAAEKHYRECVAIIRSTVSFEHPEVPRLIANFARLLEKRGKRDEADDFFKEIIQAQERRFGPKHFRVANGMIAYAELLNEWKDGENLEKVCGAALKIYQQTGGPRRNMYTRCGELLNLSQAYRKRGNEADAERLLQNPLP
jgi:tetratricopeptide (TPR) repeat protein